MKGLAIYILILLLIAGFVRLFANAQASDVALYEIGRTTRGTKIYKQVYQGCELFIVEGDRGNDSHGLWSEYETPVAIATGRGCR